MCTVLSAVRNFQMFSFLHHMNTSLLADRQGVRVCLRLYLDTRQAITMVHGAGSKTPMGLMASHRGCSLRIGRRTLHFNIVSA